MYRLYNSWIKSILQPGYAGAFYGGKAAQTTETTESKSQMEREITRSMFAIRMEEMRAAWFKNR